MMLDEYDVRRYMDQRGCYLSNLKIKVDNNLCNQHYFHKPNSVVKKLFYLSLKLNFHAYNSPILVNKPINKPIRNREIFWTSNDGPCYCYFEQVTMAHRHCLSPCLLLWCWWLWKGFPAAFDLSVGTVLVHYRNIALWTPSFPRKLYFVDKIIHVQPDFVLGQFWMVLKCFWWIHYCSFQKSLTITFVSNSSIHVYNFVWKLKKPKKSFYFSAIFQTCFCLISGVWVNPSQETLSWGQNTSPFFLLPSSPPVRSYLGSRVQRD